MPKKLPIKDSTPKVAKDAKSNHKYSTSGDGGRACPPKQRPVKRSTNP